MSEEQVNTATSSEPSQEILGRSPQIGELVGALAAAQVEFTPVKKAIVNTQFNSKYADLDAVIDATRPAMAKHGIVLMQFSETDMATKQLTMRSLMAHKSGQWIESRLTLPATMRQNFDAQSIGSAMTYARRYSWQGMVGVAAEVDDDGNQASDKGSKEAAKTVADKKLLEMKAKSASGALTSNGGLPEALASHPEEVYGLLKASKEQFRKDDKEKKRPFRKIEMLDPNDKPLTLYCFHDTQYGDTTLFNILDMAATGKGQPAKFSVGYEKDFAHIKLPIVIGPLQFDSDGVPMLDANRDA